MVLTVTGTISVVEANRGVVRDLFIAALGCNLAWDVIDAVLYLMGRFSGHGQNILALRAVQTTQDATKRGALSPTHFLH